MRIITSITVLVLLLVGGTLVVPPAGQAQKGATIPRIGFLSPSSLDPRTSRLIGAFREGLRELGYIEGQNIAIEFRWAEGKYDRLVCRPSRRQSKRLEPFPS